MGGCQCSNANQENNLNVPNEEDNKEEKKEEDKIEENKEEEQKNENDKSTVISYTCERFNCEVCEKPYPLRFQIQFDKNKEPITYYLIDGLELPEDTDYMILESLTYVKNKKNYKNIYVIKLTGDDIL